MIWFPYYLNFIFLKWLQIWQVTKFYTFWNQLCTILAWKHVFRVTTWTQESHYRAITIKKENKSISSLLIKTTNNDFYMLILFNSYRREADMQENKARPFNSSFCNNFDSEASVIFSWPSPLPFYSKIVSLETWMRHTIRKWQQFRNRKCEMSNSWRKFFLLPMK